MADEALAAFMDVTGCGYDDAFHRLASCGGHLGKAVNRFFNADAGTSSGTTTRRRSSPPPPSPQPQLISSDDDSDPEYVPAATPPPRAPVPALLRAKGGGARGRSPPPSGSSPSVSRSSDSKTARGGSSRRRRRRRGRRGEEASVRAEKKRRVAEDDDEPRAGRKMGSSRRRRRRLDMFASSSDEEEEKVKMEEPANTSRRQRRRLNPKSGASDSEVEEVHVTTTSTRTLRPNRGNNRYTESAFTFGSDDDMDLAESAPPPPASKKADRDALFRAPHGLTYRCGSFHGAKAEAARRRRWLLVNVQGLDISSLAQNRDVWASDLVADCVKEHFVLWQADAGDVDGGGEAGDEEEVEARKVLCYYKVPLDRVPVVVVVDPVTGEAVERLHGTGCTDPNDFLVSIGPYTDKKPESFPVVGAAAKKSAASDAALQNDQNPPPAVAVTNAPTSRKEQPVREPDELPNKAAAAASVIGQQVAPGEKVCKMRVRMPDGRVVEQEFGSQRAVAALFDYCRSELGTEKPLRLLHFVGVSREAIGDKNASFESLGLHMSTVCVSLG